MNERTEESGRMIEIRHMGRPDSAKRILLVEDNEDGRGALAQALETEGYEVVAVANGLEALDHLRWSWRPACVVLDMRLPVMTGWELRKTMQDDPKMRGIPVIGVTGGRWKPEDARGFFALIAKPINVNELLASLESVWHSRGGMESPSLVPVVRKVREQDHREQGHQD